MLVSVIPLHVLVKAGGPHKGSTALSLLAHQLGRPVSTTHVILQLVLQAKLLSTAKLLARKGFFFLMDNLDVGGQGLLNSKVL